MKAAVLYPDETLPRYTDAEEPRAQNDKEILVSVKAVAIKHLDKSIASGRHYSSAIQSTTGTIPGGDGIVTLPDGSRAYGMGIGGMLAEKALIHGDRIVKLPDGLDDAIAAALPNAVVGAAMGLKFKADMQKGAVVLVNGATGVTGRIAVQLARHYGAGKVIATGRNAQSLAELLSLGADETIAITGDDENFRSQLAAIHATSPFDVVIDYLWGRTAELILAVLKGKGMFTNPVKYVSVGSMAGDAIQLSAAILRSVDLQLTGSGMGSWPKRQVGQIFTEILPEAFELAVRGLLKLETVTAPLSEVAELWKLNVPGGKRLVVTV